MYRIVFKITNHMTKLGIKHVGTDASITPAPVATPLPPLNFKKGEKMCPAIQLTAVTNTAAEGSGIGRLNPTAEYRWIETGIKPFRASQIRTIQPSLEPKFRKTLVAPGLPLPIVRMSFLWKIRQYR